VGADHFMNNSATTEYFARNTTARRQIGLFVFKNIPNKVLFFNKDYPYNRTLSTVLIKSLLYTSNTSTIPVTAVNYGTLVNLFLHFFITFLL
jgi:hypothetical protein